MKVSYGEGLANHSGLQRRAGIGNDAGPSVRAEGNAGQPLSSEIITSACRSCPVLEKATWEIALTRRVVARRGGVVDPVHVWKFQAREPGDPIGFRPLGGTVRKRFRR